MFLNFHNGNSWLMRGICFQSTAKCDNSDMIEGLKWLLENAVKEEPEKV
jgi:hypothetical protein